MRACRHRTPYGRILGPIIGVEDFEQIVRDFFASQAGAGASVQVCLDGKTMRGTVPTGQSRGLHLLGVFPPGEGWMIVVENGAHYRRDQTLREDWCHLRIGHAGHMMSAINNLILQLLLGRGVTNVPEAQRQYAAHWNDALHLVLRR